MDALLIGLVWFLIYVLVLAIVAYIVVRLASQFVPGFAAFSWIVWCIFGLIVLIMAIRLFTPVLH